MSESNQEGYRTLGWIMAKSEQGLFLAVADEAIQSEIMNIYRNGLVGIYDYRRHPGDYSFPILQEWVLSLPQMKTFLIVNFHLALQNENSVKRLNFSRDMLEGLGKNFIFFVPQYMDDRLAVGAYDFYSFLKLRVTFHTYEMECVKEEKLISEESAPVGECEWKPEELKQKMAESYALIEEARDEYRQAHYDQCKKLLLKAREIKEKLLGTEHLEVAAINCELADVYGEQGKYQEAEKLYKKSLQIREQILGEEHPDTATSYNNLAVLYAQKKEYHTALSYYMKAYTSYISTLGMNHQYTKNTYENMKWIFEIYHSEESFQHWLEKKMKGQPKTE